MSLSTTISWTNGLARRRRPSRTAHLNVKGLGGIHVDIKGGRCLEYTGGGRKHHKTITPHSLDFGGRPIASVGYKKKGRIIVILLGVGIKLQRHGRVPCWGLVNKVIRCENGRIICYIGQRGRNG